MNIAYSPCPNDTFIFHAWAHGLVPGAPELQVTYADIDITNHLAARREGPEVMKISYAALPWVLEHYRLLPCGGALGRGCGPLVLTKEPESFPSGSSGPESDLTQAGERSGNEADGPPAAYSEPKSDYADKMTAKFVGALLAGKRVAVPSERSTAYLLFRLWAEQQVPGGVGEIIVMPFHEIMPAVRDGLMDAGLVIHEARFTYGDYGLHMLTDLGSWWEADTGLPIPLGAIIARRELDGDAISGWIRSSLDYAWSHPDASSAYVMEHAQELSPQVVQSHIELYVNDFSRDLGDAGYAAIESLLGRAAEQGLVPAFDLGLLRR
ncbi:1,4-dihydroxy-6-naphthoate synthase [Paenibacillus sp. LHD-117]|uniref:1,4-dihydroxy-6-naphthoate synthase n=1 Tax=Paenibacillus sp. LHD-117 TaxID=3071412 RepID=UPI0027E04FAC|nr:1,4-dihydroxy-6-naphthoate synthase [Paenibacillus sp. LHD-117]MDQ6418757.1 1,4-dihydroxy-6-naphthoate synthase [Paenibacillus sp. LHD-117]